jgi:hypothetical protein
MAPESLYYVSGYTCEWYQAQSPKQWPATSGIAVHADHDRFIMFDTPSEKVMCRFVTCAEDIRTFPIDNRRDGIGFIIDELKARGWVGNFVYEMSDTASDKVFQPGTCVNFESQFFSPRMSRITYYICTLLFKEDSALLPVTAPRELVVIE